METSHANTPIAIVGMACRLPGSATLEQYWDLIRRGRSAIVELPDEILNRELYYCPEKGVQGKSYSLLGGLAPRIAFDRSEYDLPDAVWDTTDVAHLNLCAVAADALRHAGMNPLQVRDRRAGVYIGHAGGSRLAGDLVYATMVEETAAYLHELEALRDLGRDRIEQVVRRIVEDVRARYPHRDDEGGPDLAANVAAGIISRAFHLDGPYMAIDAACASSLKALLLGARALQQGRIDMALVGGASYCKSDSLVLFSQAQSVSATGSRPFDADADGLISSEGYITLVLKTLDKALADGDPVHGVIRGLGMSSDGKGKSLWAPRKEGQIVAMERAYQGGLDPARLQYIEAHATSTQLGDATELTALSEVLKENLPPGTKLPIGGVKANIGHTLETAGVAGLVKVVLAMQNRVIPPAINVRNLNPKIDWDNVPLFVPQQEMPWGDAPGGLPRRAAVNAFGIGGLNIHVVVDEFVREKPTSVYYSDVPGEQIARSAQPAAIPKDEGIAIIGMGAIVPGAQTIDAFWQLLESGRDPKSDGTPDRWPTHLAYEAGTTALYRSPTLRGGYITDYKYDWRKHKVPPKQVQNANPLQFMLLDAADQALEDSGYKERPLDRKRVGVVVGTIFGGDFADRLQMGLRLPEFSRTLAHYLRQQGVPEDQIESAQDEYKKVLLKYMPALADETGSFTSSTLASKITKTFDLMGGALALDAGPGSALAAMSASMDILRSGACDMMICAAGQSNMDLVTYEGLSMGRRLAAGEVRSEFDASGSGIVPGEGVGVLLLKRESDARHDGDRIHGILRAIAGSTNLEATHKATELAMRRALQDASVPPSEVSALETTTTGSFEEVSSEVASIANVYAAGPRSRQLLLNSSTDQLGHTGGATGMISTIKSALALEHRSLPGGLGVAEPAPFIRQYRETLQALSASAPLAPAPTGRSLMAITAGSGSGLTFHAVLEGGEKVPVEPAPRGVESSPAAKEAPATVPVQAASNTGPQWQTVRIGAGSLDELQAKLGKLTPQIPQLLSGAGTAFVPEDEFRLAVVTSDADDLAKKLKLAAEQVGNPQSRQFLEGQGVFCRRRPAQPPRVALMSPGQSSQYVGMLRELIAELPAAAAAQQAADRAMAEAGYPGFAEYAWNDNGALGKDNWTTQVSILLANSILCRSLEAFGVKPDVVAGHSYGETPALVSAGAWDLAQAIRVTRRRCEILDACIGRGCMMATTAPAEIAEQAVREVGGPVYVANYNAPRQTVISGTREAVQQVIDGLAAKKQKARLLAVPCPFHSPLMSDCTEPFRQVMQAATIVRPQVPVLSSITNRYVADPDDIRDNLSHQLTTPVRYVELVRKLAAEAPTVFVEAGPQQVLTGLNPRILEDPEGLFIASDNPRRPGTWQLHCVRALLETVGVFDRASDQPALPAHSASPQPVAAVEQPRSAPSRAGRTIYFDATLRRKEKQQRAVPTGAKPAAKPAALAEPAPETSSGSPATTREKAPSDTAASTDVSSKNGRAAPSNGRYASPPGPNGQHPKTADLEKFLIDFVVDETGYPPEIVELDADLEGDLGIDSIKKAQLFGELGEHFPITPDENTSLDDFTTLRHVMEYIQQHMGHPSEAPSSAQSPSAGTGGAEATPGAAEASQSTGASHAAKPATGAARPLTATAAVPAAPAAPSPAAPAPEPAAQAAPAIADEELERFLVNFVVEETGYPPEIVELDADLEGDLGIDSIKKAQLFGELGEHFPITPDENTSLDDFTTLRHVKEYIQQQLGATAEEATPPAAASHDQVNTTAFGAPHQTTATPASEQTAHESAAAASSPAHASADAEAPSPAKLEAFLINFVVEETGYPPEIVELDADLEGDLGIDSIKKAQLFGELGEHFPITPDENTSLDEFPTLRHVRDYILAALSQSGAPAVPAPPEAGGNGRPEPTGGFAETSFAEEAAGTNGHAYDAGFEYGRTNRLEIRNSLRSVADRFGYGADQFEPAVYEPREEQFEQLRGIADGAEVALDSLLAGGQMITAELLPSIGTSVQPGKKIPAPRSAPPSKAVSAGRANVAQASSSGAEVGTPSADTPAHGASGAPAASVSPPFPETPEPASRVMKRFVLRVSEAPLPADRPAAPAWQGAAIILGNNRRTEALEAAIERSGGTVHHLLVSRPEDAVARLEQLWQAGAAPHLFITTACDDLDRPGTAEKPWSMDAVEELLLPFRVCQRWIELVEAAGLLERATLVAATTLGGDFGFQSGSPNITGGGVAGMFKGIRREYEKLRVKVIDTPPSEDPARVAQEVLAELGSGAPEGEVAYQQGRRHLVTALAQPAPVAGGPEIPRGGTWVLTGGARGVTALVARELGRRFGLKLHLIGASPLPQIDPSWRELSEAGLEELKVRVMREARERGEAPMDGWKRVQKALEIDRNLRSMAAEGIPATYHGCDVTDRRQMSRLLDAIRREDGPIEGVVHGAGVEIPCRFTKKKVENVRATIGSKVDGSLALAALTRDDPLRYFITFGSNSGRFGGHGQADYSAASDMQCKVVDWLRTARPEVASCAFHWPSWDDIGMATRPEIKAGLKRAGLGFMPPEEGIAHLFDELAAGLPEQEVLIVDRPYLVDIDGTMTRSTPAAAPPRIDAPKSPEPRTGERVESSGQAGAAPASLGSLPMIDDFSNSGPGAWIAHSNLDPTHDVFLVNHRLNNRPFLPAVAAMEMFCEAASLVLPEKRVFGLRNVDLSIGFTCRSEKIHPVEIRLRETDGGVACQLVADYYNDRGQLVEPGRVHASAVVELNAEGPTIEPVNPGEPVYGWSEVRYPDEGLAIYHGEPLRCFKELDFQHDGGRAKLVARDPLELAGQRQGTVWFLPSAVLDGCLYACGTYAFAMLERRVELPLGVDRLFFSRLPQEGEECTLRFYYRGPQGDGNRYDFTLLDSSGEPILAAEGYRTVLLTQYEVN